MVFTAENLWGYGHLNIEELRVQTELQGACGNRRLPSAWTC